MTIPAEFKFVNWITGQPVPIDDAMASAFTDPIDPDLLTAYINALINAYDVPLDTSLRAALSSAVADILTPTVQSDLLTAFTNLVNSIVTVPPQVVQGFLINGNGIINQRGTTTTADDAYGGPDRWYSLTQTNTISASQGTAGATGIPYYSRITQTQAVAQRMGRAQIVENANCSFAASENVVLSGKIRCSSSQAIRYAILNWTGTADTVTSDVVLDWTSSSYTAGGFFLASNLTVVAVGSITPSAATWTDITEITAALGSTVNNLIVFVWTEGTAAQNVTLDFVLKLEVGTTATEYLHIDIQEALYQCLRYYERCTWAVGGDAAGFGSRVDGTYSYACPKRITPSITKISNGANINIRGGDPNTYLLFGGLFLTAKDASLSAEANAAGFVEGYNVVSDASAEL